MKRSIVQFSIFKEGAYYTASGVGIPIVTQAKTLDALVKNIREAVALHFDDEGAESTEFTSHPSILANMELAYV